MRFPRLLSLALLGLALGLSGHSSARAQVVSVEAFSGRPFGVGKIVVAVDNPRPDEAFIPLADDRFSLRERTGRALYPVMNQAPLRRLVRQFLDLDMPQRVAVYFLFRGDEPLDLTLFTPEPYRATVRPIPVTNRRADRQRGRLLGQWWREYTQDIKRLEKQSEYPLLVENYLAANLARRMNLRLPLRLRPQDRRGELAEAVSLMMGTESIAAALQQETLIGGGGYRGPATLPLPQPPPLAEVEFPPVPDDVPVEAIAAHVPVECFYIRFGNFNNYLWLREFLERWGGDIRNMVNVRAVDYRTNARLQQQIGLKESSLAKILGPTVIADVAMIGNDLLMKDGASFGILFQARNNFALSSDFNGQRTRLASELPDAKLETVEIAGREVSFLHTPDNRVRSFYAVDDDMHLVTTSRHLMQRFLEAGAGKGSLAVSNDFRYARTVRPLELDDTVFAYFSDDFFRQFAGPKYRVEMQRRAQSVVEMNLLRMARWAARAEGQEAFTIEQLVAADLLPANFGRRTDGSRLVTEGEEILDSRRGLRGSFIPVADMQIEAVSEAEAAAYHRFIEAYRSEWGTADPVLAGIQRVKLNDQGLERMVIDVNATPYARSHYTPFINFVGQPTRRALAPIRGDVVSLQVRTSGQGLLGLPASGTGNHLFLGIRDFRPPLLVKSNTVLPGVRTWELMRGYIGAWPRPGILGLLFGTDALAPGFGLQGWQRAWEEFVLLSFKRDVVAAVAPQVHIIEAERPAQVRLRIADLSGRSLAEAANALGYMRARQTSISGARLMNTLTDQLHVPPEQSREVAEDLVDGKLTCALGGTYTLVEYPSGFAAWTSTALVDQNRFVLSDVPEDFQFPLLKWFRGLQAELTVDPLSLSAHTELDLQLEPVEAAAEPAAGGGFQFPSLKGLGFGGGEDDSDDGGQESKRKPESNDPFAEELPAPKKSK